MGVGCDEEVEGEGGGIDTSEAVGEVEVTGEVGKGQEGAKEGDEDGGDGAVGMGLDE